MKNIFCKSILPKQYLFSTYHRYNPYNREIIYEGRNLDSNQILKAIDNSQIAQIQWAQRSVGERIDLIKNFLNVLQTNKLRLAVIITEAVGKPITQSVNEIDTAIFVSQRLLKQAIIFRENILMNQTTQKFVQWEPVGVVLQFSPWNWPVLYTLIKMIPALVSGNSVLLKHSYMTPQVGQVIQNIFQELGAGTLVQNMEISNYDLRELISNQKIGYLSYIGSYNTGMKIYEDACYQSLIDVTLRFSGKDGAYVRADADLVQAARIIMESAFENAGQSDLAVKRIYVNNTRYDEFKDLLVEMVLEKYKPGDPMLDNTNLGPLAEPDQLPNLQKLTEDAVYQGARVLCGGTEIWDQNQSDAVYFAPTVIADVENDMEVVQEEFLGPIVTLSEVQDDEQAIQLLNDSKYGNAVSIFSKNKQGFMNIAQRLNVGQVYGNHCNYYDSVELPHDPRKQSGRGVFLSSNTFYEYVKPKSHNYKLSLK